MKKNIVLFLACLFCFGCATSNIVNRGANYTENTKVFSYFNDGKVGNYREKGYYDEYFNKITDINPNYQLVYHHPGDYSVDTYSYYIALVRFSNKNENLQARATYNGVNLPVAVNYTTGISTLNYVNILLTKEQLIDAYENVGKMVISLVVDGNKYNIVFPDYYLRKVLAQTTNIDKYKIAEQLANPPAPAPAPVPVQNYAQEKQNQPATKPLRKPFEYSNNYSFNLSDRLGDLTQVSFDYSNTYPCSVNLHVVADLQEYSFGNGHTDSYIKSISVKENNVNEKSCNKIDLKVYEGGPSLHITIAANENDKDFTETIDLKGITERIYIKNLRKSKI